MRGMRMKLSIKHRATERAIHQRNPRRVVWTPWILAVLSVHGVAIPRQHLAKLRQIQVMSSIAEWRQILFREPEQTHCGPEPFPVFRMFRMLELLLQMDKRARGLDESFEILRVLRRDRVMQPNLLQNIVRFVIALLVPTLKKRPVIGMG